MQRCIIAAIISFIRLYNRNRGFINLINIIGLIILNRLYISEFMLARIFVGGQTWILPGHSSVTKILSYNRNSKTLMLMDEGN